MGVKTRIMLLSIFVFVFYSVATGHSVEYKIIEEFKIEFKYSDGVPMSRSRITLYDKEGNKIVVKKTTKEGIFDYSEYKDLVKKIVIDDGDGHIFTYHVEEKD